MADVVQYRLERMVDELDDLERKGIFTHREIAEIVKKRRNFEYRLKRPGPLKEDFVAYIEYEKQLDSLRRLRRKSVVRQLKEKGNKKLRKSVSDFAGVSRILEIYRLAVMRFKGDIDLWFQYLEFCREQGHGRMKQVLAQAIRFHPKVPGLWIYAAAWEFDHNLNVAAARALMHSGLRACPTSEDLWVEYLRMELTYLNKLTARKAAIGEEKGTLARDGGDADEKQWRDENKDLFMAFNEERENADGSDVQNGEAEKKVDVFREKGSILLRTIYSEAIEALPSSISLRKRFLEIVDATDLQHSEELKEEITSSMKRDFSNEPEYWDWLARLQIKNPANVRGMSKEAIICQLNKAVEIYEEALTVVPSAKMFSLYANFLMDIIAPERKDSQDSWFPSTSSNEVEFISHLLKAYELAETMGLITEDLGCQYISFYLQLGRLEEARKLAEKLCDGTLFGAAKLWVLRVAIEMRWMTRKSAAPSNDDLRSIFELLRNVLSKISISESESLWIMALKIFSNKKDYFDKLVQTSLGSLARGGESGSQFSLPSAIVNCVLEKEGIQRAREMYKRFLALPHPSLAIYKNCIELEMNLALVGDNDGLVNARKLYESALATYSQDLRLWRDYYSMETKVGTSETANAVHWRARKTLKDAASLIANDL
ncbi:U3 small nucleolar RNA-associated protein 6 homolog [Macadamia integrifolia]|uniref:U3 small nucleolar RNA-associated protein 6 homolog n=1 Tax=Macadamia integrifolia TaxID=60698 RepID=UPI001C4F57D9|nr:U3 small nucleolar RNA-associated protein 6 homolog [Macadamia integrifolia]